FRLGFSDGQNSCWRILPGVSSRFSAGADACGECTTRSVSSIGPDALRPGTAAYCGNQCFALSSLLSHAFLLSPSGRGGSAIKLGVRGQMAVRNTSHADPQYWRRI